MQIKRRRKNTRLWINAVASALCVLIVLTFLMVFFIQSGTRQVRQAPAVAQAVVTTATQPATEPPTEADTEPETARWPVAARDVMELTESNLYCTYAVLLDLQDYTILAQRNAETQLYPASMTKIMTLLVAAEEIEDLEDTFTMTYEIIAPLIEQDASRAGFMEGETVTMTDLLYGIALPSGADATIAIAEYVCGSEEAFVDLMNAKAEQLGLEHTHFVNTSGLHDEDHYTTAVDMAVLMGYVMQNDVCREILGTYQYRTSSTEEHPDGIMLESTMYSRMYGTEVTGITITGGKTGYTDQSMHCLVSYAEDEEGTPYVAVVAYAPTYWDAIYDTFALYGIIDDGYPLPTDLATQTETTETATEATTAPSYY